MISSSWLILHVANYNNNNKIMYIAQVYLRNDSIREHNTRGGQLLRVPLSSTRCTRGVRVFFCRARMRSRKSARMNKSNFTIEKIVVCTHDSDFEIVVYRNVDNCIQLLA